ncbi:thermostable hemolysin [Alteromonas gilva]|uniref:Thermostable hemolysin n=1 Tax=Alteromonas gilva TaxID=2987522 RepID=A0ABT5KYJ9_9ALTE|nr:thermostable hemolysin [Alteromonas gilva]MDC8829281.1 thermostable hemolysin [Alteromonas gilva]
MLSTSHTVLAQAPGPHSAFTGAANVPAVICAANQHHRQRAAIERHIANGFRIAYQASITEFMPLLVGLGGHKIEAALGIRSGRAPMFVETYFDTSLPEALSEHGLNCPRHRLAEIGNLYSASSRYTMALLLLTATALFQQRISVLVFTATDALQRMMARSGLMLHYLTPADESKLLNATAGNASQHWGSYYQTHPQVVAVKVADIIQLTLDNPSLRASFSPFASLSAVLSAELGAQL